MKHIANSAAFLLTDSLRKQTGRKPARQSRNRRTKGRPVLGAIVRIPSLVSKMRAAKAVIAVAPSVAILGMKEQEWIQSHWPKYVGRWVALDGDNLVGEAPVAREALEQARARGVGSPFLVHVTEPSELPFGGW
jgi:hypothetical protein